MIPEIFLLTGIMILFTFSILVNKTKKEILITNNLEHPLQLQTAINIIAILLIVLYIFILFNNPFINFNLIYKGLPIVHINSYAIFLKYLITLTLLVVLFLYFNYFQKEKLTNFEIIILMLFALFGMIITVTANNYLLLYLSIELQSLSFYILAAIKRNSILSTEAGLKYVILGAVSSGILLLGCALTYGQTGSTFFDVQSQLLTFNADSTMLIGLICLSVAFFFKIGAAPFHMWVPDVYEGSPTIITTLFATVGKIPIFGILVYLFYHVYFNIFFELKYLFITIGIISIVIGAIGALAQNNIKRLLAYSAILNVGYLILGFSMQTIEGLNNIFFFLIIYLIMNLNLFGILMSLRFKNDSRLLKNIYDLAGLGKTNPVLAFVFSLSIFSLIGIPPLAGFLGKLLILETIVKAGFVPVAFLMVLVTILAASYYLRLIKIMYFDTPTTPIEFEKIDFFSAIIFASFTLIIIFLLFNPNILFYNISPFMLELFFTK